MPFQISFAINACHYISKILGKSDKIKNEFHCVEGGDRPTCDDNVEHCTEKERDVLLHLTREDTKRFPFVIPSSMEEEHMFNITDEDLPTKDQESIKPNEKSKNYFKKLFLKRQLKTSKENDVDFFNKCAPNPKESAIESNISYEEFPASGGALETFSAMLNSGQSLSSLIGKEFTLTTPVTVQAVENIETSEPNILLKGTIPFKYATPEGIRKRKVHVSGRICKHPVKNSATNLSKEPSCGSFSSCSGRCSLTKIDLIKPQNSLQFPVNWKSAKVYEKQDYIVQCGICRKKKASDVDFKQLSKKDKSKKKIKGKDATKSAKSLKTMSSDKSVKKRGKKAASSGDVVKGSKRQQDGGREAVGDVESESEESYEPLVDVPISSITITRSRTRFITYNDGTEYVEKCGKETVTLKAPKGMYFNENDTDSESSEESNGRNIRANAVMIHPLQRNSDMETHYTRDAYFFVRNGNPNTFPYDIFEQEYNVIKSAFAKKKLKLNTTNENCGFNSKISYRPVSYPPNDYSEILEDKYNPLTWIYKSYNKTKNFVRGFSVQE